MNGTTTVREATTAVGPRLDLACGPHKERGWLGVDLHDLDGVDVVADLTVFPWPWADGTIEEIRCSHFFEHLSGTRRIAFMDEVWRVLKPGGKATIITPYYTSVRATMDPTHVFPPLSEQSFMYFDRTWRRAAGVDHYLGQCDFSARCKLIVDKEWQIANPDMDIKDAARHFWNVVSDIEAELTREDR